MLVLARIRRRLRRRRQGPADKPRQPVVGKGGDDEEAAAGPRLPRLRHQEHDARRRRRRRRQRRGRRPGGLSPRARATPARPPSRSSTAKDWRAAISAAQLMSRPLRAPILLSDGDELPDATQSALDALGPTGAEKAGNAQVIRIGKTAKPEGLRSSDVEGADPSALAAGDRPAAHRRRRRADAARSSSRPSSAPEFAMPAAAWAAKAGDPVLWARPRRAPRRHQGRDHRPPAPAHLRARPGVGDLRQGAQASSASSGTARRISGAGAGRATRSPSRASPTAASAGTPSTPATGSCSRRTKRPADAAAAAPLSAAGTYGPLLLVTEADALPGRVQDYLLDIQPGYDDDPVRGVYNHGWLIGRRDGDLGRRAVADRRAARDPARAARAS